MIIDVILSKEKGCHDPGVEGVAMNIRKDRQEDVEPNFLAMYRSLINERKDCAFKLFSIDIREEEIHKLFHPEKYPYMGFVIPILGKE